MRRMAVVAGVGLALGVGCGSNGALDGGPADMSAAVADQASPSEGDSSLVEDAAVAGPGADAASAPDLAGPDMAMAVHELVMLAGADGLGTPVIDASPDEAGNLWAVTPDALYIRRAGETRFRRYTNADGLHIDSQILSVAGGGISKLGVGDGYVGLLGVETGNEDDAPAIREPGKAEHVTLHPDGTITSVHYWNMHTDVSANFWITRSAYRLLYVHEGAAAGHVFMGGNHGISHIFDDGWGDHVHVEVYYPDHSGTYGLWFGLAMDPTTGGLWTCGKEACGLQNWAADPRAWANGKYKYAFTVFTGDHALDVPFGYRENFVGAAATPDGTAWFLSRDFGLARWRPSQGGYDYQHIEVLPVPGLGTPVDVASDREGVVYIADTDKVLRLDPSTNDVRTLALPVGDVRRLYVDTRVSPRAVYVSSGSGLAVYRGR